MGEIQEGTIKMMERLVSKFIVRYPRFVQGQVRRALNSAYNEIRKIDNEELISTLLDMREDINKMLGLSSIGSVDEGTRGTGSKK
jgi:hypothetical protein